MQPPTDYLPSIVPELKTFGLTIDFVPPEPLLVPGDFIVSVGKGRKVGTVYQVITRRFVKSKKYPLRCAFRVVKCPELKKDVRVNFRFKAQITGQNVNIITIVWNPRNKKKKP